MLDEEMDGVAREERAKLESIEAELAEVRGRMDRLWHAVETSDLEVNDILPRLRKHQERQERFETAAEDARRTLSERRVLLDSVETSTAFAREMSEFRRTSDLTESKAGTCRLDSGPFAADVPRRRPAHGDDPVERGGGGVGVDAPGGHDRQRLPRVLVDDVEQLQDPPVRGLVELEVERPDVVRTLSPQPPGGHRRVPQALTLASLQRDARPLLTPEPLHPLAVHTPQPSSRKVAQARR